ncbi:uncharacterized protein LOC127262751 isoform X1 [Andrographis paniculata]|uniref:uncharacterized protein LOC127262751 isoform X1 n=1 Tax=Andrographis paniculata TaxID=175694 RepID=UPI0021E8E34E|nr:uncharacterized protein LOC127262751 isoform X1 [Andrographis paniculata]XP_051147515.1 uncharacterized protein LOC127262751 isoform X1 [Andrographis paniculata]XP_051147516.1 uncharacterized protein LOC127262751 isoform X1 [Andrographis paniculata]XP_051147517.1 uncharacterized protein LOC127262751 isoform X1 [Andrographis paniculata]XP_051147518.1 uncharacterized protein LOC127262751 isoform X1 [Andrographis paniculata]
MDPSCSSGASSDFKFSAGSRGMQSCCTWFSLFDQPSGGRLLGIHLPAGYDLNQVSFRRKARHRFFGSYYFFIFQYGMNLNQVSGAKRHIDSLAEHVLNSSSI